VWCLDPHRDTIGLKLRFAHTPDDQDNDADGPDNIAVSPFGRAIPAEDGEGTSHLVGATSPGEAVEQDAAMWALPVSRRWFEGMIGTCRSPDDGGTSHATVSPL
jgi:Alkaline phosphatase PhoX